VSVVLAATAGLLFAVGTYLVLQRKLSRIIIGLGLLTHGANVLMVTAGRRGRAPLIGSAPTEGLADPLPQALALTAIVISFGVTALLLALAYRSWLLSDDDEIHHDAPLPPSPPDTPGDAVTEPTAPLSGTAEPVSDAGAGAGAGDGARDRS
jgi:multicomponent Na+:H+ antiporter subunit C